MYYLFDVIVENGPHVGRIAGENNEIADAE